MARGNNAFVDSDWSEAMKCYWQAAKNCADLRPFIENNLYIARGRWLKERHAGLQRGDALRLGVSCWDLARNPAGRALTLAEAWKPLVPEVKIIGSIFENFGLEPWPPIQSSEVVLNYFICQKQSLFLQQAMELVVANPLDVLHVSKPRLPSLIFAWLYEQVWGARILLDIDDEEMGFISSNSDKKNLTEFNRLSSRYWTQWSIDHLQGLQLRTVSNVALQQRYHGTMLPHVRPVSRFSPSEKFSREMRRYWQIPESARVVLFSGTPRQHKGLMETAKIISALEDPNLWLVIAGDFPPKLESMKEELKAITGLQVRFLPGHSYNRIAEVVAIGDITLLLQDPDSLISQFQLPAKLMDALAMGLTVLATPTKPLQPFIEADVVTPVSEADVAQKLQNVLYSDLQVQARRNRAYFMSELSVESKQDTMKDLLDELLAGKPKTISWEGQLDLMINHPLEWLNQRSHF